MIQGFSSGRSGGIRTRGLEEIAYFIGMTTFQKANFYAQVLGHTDYQTTANIYTHLKSDMMKKSSVDMEDVFRRKKEAKSALAKAQATRDKRSRKPVLDMSLPWAGKF